MKKTKEKEKIKERVKGWASASGPYRDTSILDFAIMETFFFLYNGLVDGRTIQEMGVDLGVLPWP
jgi:hypothetical protein